MLAADPQSLATFWTSSSSPDEFASVGDQVVFTLDELSPGSLWLSDGTSGGTSRFDNTNSRSQPIRFGDKFVFVTNNQLHISDGTQEGTVRLLLSIDHISNLTVVNGNLYFSARGPWISDGTPEGTRQLKNSDSSSFVARDFTAVGDTIYFALNQPGFGDELWKTDGTEAGTLRVADLAAGATSSVPGYLTNVNGVLYFATFGASPAYRLWKSDGTPEGTTPITNVASDGNYVTDLINVNGTLHFVAYDDLLGNELWRTDGTEDGTFVVADINPGDGSSLPLPVMVQGDSLVFWAATDDGDWKLWRTDDSAAGASLVKDILSPELPFLGMQPVGELGDSTYFRINLGSRGIELWRTDGTTEGTQLVSHGFFEFGEESVAVGGLLYFSASDGIHGKELWRTDGTPDGTRLVKDIRTAKQTPFTIGATVEVNGAGYFSAVTAEGSSLVRVHGDQVRILLSGVSPRLLTNVAGILYFEGSSGGVSQLWRSDGTTRGTYVVTSLAEGESLASLTAVGSRLHFVRQSEGAYELWSSDGTALGTVPVRDFGAAAPSSLLNVAGTLYFVASDSEHGAELWSSDGTFTGTALVRDIRAGTESSNPTQLTNVAGTLYFQAFDDGSGTELWTSDGTETGTIMVDDIVPGPGSSQPLSLVAVGEELFFTANDGVVGRELWKAAGSTWQAVLVKDVWPGPASSLVRELTAMGGKLYFVADDGTHGQELWTSGGHAVDTRLVEDIVAGAGSSFPAELEAVGWHLYFKAYRPDINIELWRTDGSPQSTIYWDFNNSPSRSQVEHLANVDGALYFFVDEVFSVLPKLEDSLVVNRRLFYNHSKFDGGDASAQAADDGAIAADKVAYLPGSGLATSASVSSYSRGINGVMIDIANVNGELTVDDFTFRVGTSSSPESWVLAPAPLEVIVRAGAGVGGSDRVTITWADGAIKNTWLQVIVEGNDAAGGFNTNTGLAESDVFYFGNRVGDTFVGALAASTVTSAADELGARFNPGINQPVTNVFDFNRDGVVSAADQLIARNNGGLLLMLDVDEAADEELAEALPLNALTAPRGRSTGKADAAMAFALATAELDEDLSDELIDGFWRRSRR